MNLKALFQRLRPPKKSGTKGVKSPGPRKVPTYWLRFSSIEDAPEYQLEGVLSVGSEAGDIVIDDATLAPRHALFKLEKGTVTVMDVGSSSGTKVGEHQLTKGKPVLLRPEDVVELGEILVALVVKEIIVDEQAADEAPSDVDFIEEAPEEIPPMPEAPAEKDASTGLKNRLEELKLISEKKKKGKAVKSVTRVIGGGRVQAANVLPRFFGLLFDLLLASSVWVVVAPIDEVAAPLKAVFPMIGEALAPLAEELVAAIGVEAPYQQALAVAKDLLESIGLGVPLAEVLTLVVVLRLFWTLLTGTSLGLWMAGVRSAGNPLVTRFLGAVRELLGLITGPLLIFDLPALFSRRTLKEFVTFTRLSSISKGATTISWLLFFPLTLGLLAVAPMFVGFEEPTAIALKTVPAGRREKGTEGEELVSYRLQWFRAQFALPPAKWELYPRFAWAQKERARRLTPTLAFVHENGAVIPLVLEGSFQWEKLLELGLSHNPFLQQNFPTLWAFVQAKRVKDSKVLRSELSEAQRPMFESELAEFVRMSFELSLETLWDHVLSFGPLLAGPMQFRRQLRALVSDGGEGGDGEWSVGRIGKATMLIYEVSGPRPYDLMIPLDPAEGRLFRVNYAGPKERAAAVKLARGEIWARSRWFIDQEPIAASLVQVIDTVAALARGDELAEASFEAIFAAYFEKAAQLLRQEAPAQTKPFVDSLNNTAGVLAKIAESKKVAEGQRALAAKLAERLRLVLGNFESQNRPFFNL